jgi:hypothetical protein
MQDEDAELIATYSLRRRAPEMLLAGLAAVFLPGCWSAPNTAGQRELQTQRELIARQNEQITSQKATIDELNKQLAAARGIKSEDLQNIFYPTKLVIDPLSGGYDIDGRPGDEGVVLYLQPVDAAGDVLKVAGEIRIQLYDLANPPTENLIGQYVIPVEQARDLWYGKLMTNHYTIKCPWPSGPPKHSEITVHATFIEYLTKRVVSAQGTVKVGLPP